MYRQSAHILGQKELVHVNELIFLIPIDDRTYFHVMWEHSIFDFYFTSHIFPWDNYNEAVKHILIDMDYFLQLADCISYKDQGSVSVRDIKFMWEIIFVFEMVFTNFSLSNHQ